MSVLITNLCAGYRRDVPVIKGVSLELADHSITSVIGPNGSGKSTLLKAVMGLAIRISGDVSLDGDPLHDMPVHRRVAAHRIAYVPQLANVFGPLTISENLEMGGVTLPRRERKLRAHELLELYPTLRSRRRDRADSLSGGQRQLLALARALMAKPRTLLLDEPSAGLSPVMMAELFSAISAIRFEFGVTILLVEQNAEQSLQISDSGVVLVDGRVEVTGSGTDLLASNRVADLYLGGASVAASEGREL